MNDINLKLQTAYYNLLSAITYNSAPVKVYYLSGPSNPPDNFIVYGPVVGMDQSTKSSSNTATSMQVIIHTADLQQNAGLAVNDIAQSVYSKIYPKSNAVLTLSSSQMYSTEMVTDIVRQMNIKAQKNYIDRIIIFSHKILH